MLSSFTKRKTEVLQYLDRVTTNLVWCDKHFKQKITSVFIGMSGHIGFMYGLLSAAIVERKYMKSLLGLPLQ